MKFSFKILLGVTVLITLGLLTVSYEVNFNKNKTLKVIDNYELSSVSSSQDLNYGELKNNISEFSKELIATITVIVFAVVLTILLFLNKTILRPRANLMRNIRSFAEGNFDKRIKIEKGSIAKDVEIEFNNMAAKIQSLQKKFEIDLEDRTKELKLAKLNLENQGLALLNVLEDVSEEKEYESLRSKSMLETIKEGIVIVDEKGRVEYVNPSFEKLFEYSEELLKGKILADKLEICDLKDEKLPPTFLSSSSMITQDKGEAKIQIVNKNKEKIAVSISSAPIYQSDKFKGVVMVFHDFSKDLELSKQKDDFFSIASHELRTPLTVISGNLDMIIDGMGGSKLTKEDLSMLADTLESSDRLIRMVSDFLNVSRIDQGRLVIHKDKIMICDLISNIDTNYRPVVEKKGIKFVVKCAKELLKLKVEGDEDKIREVIINLLGNSLKFTKKGEIKIEGKVKDNMLEIEVSDTGMGIEKKNQSLLFHRFQQAMTRTLSREVGGTGLGLYISREFMKLMGGDLYLLSSEKGKGSVFAFTIPIVK